MAGLLANFDDLIIFSTIPRGTLIQHGILRTHLFQPKKLFFVIVAVVFTLGPGHEAGSRGCVFLLFGVHDVERSNLRGGRSKILIECIKLFKIEAGGSTEAAGPDHASDNNRDVECLGNLGFRKKLAELTNHKQRPNQRNEK